MKTKYIDLINQNFIFPQKEFNINKDQLLFHGVNLMELVEEYGSPLKYTYLPKISENINKTKKWFANAIEKHQYKGKYNYCYCTKSSHFKYVLDEALKNEIYLETSSAFDINIIEKLKSEGKLDKNDYIICNGFKDEAYITNIARLIDNGHLNCLPIIDNSKEINMLDNKVTSKVKIGIRIATEEQPKFPFYTSRLGIGYKDIIPFYKKMIENNPKFDVKMLHFFVNTGIKDSSYYWNELNKCLSVFIKLKKICPSLDSLNIGGGFPIKDSLSFDFNYEFMIDEIVNQINQICSEASVDVPNIFTEFGSFTVGESGGTIYKILSQKQQNDRERWNMIDSSFMTTLPDSWAINQRFIMLPINRWDEKYERVLLGGLTCDGDDFYNAEQHVNAIFLPIYKEDKPLYIGFFNTGAYQESIGGFSGLQHCLIPQPKHILIDRDKNNNIKTRLFSKEQTHADFLNILGYK